MAKTTKKHFKLFQEEAEYWIERFHLREWKITILHENSTLPSLKDSALAWNGCQFEDRITRIGLSTNWGKYDPITEYELSKSAFHEVCELLLGDLVMSANMDAAPTQKAQNTADHHSVIRRLEWAVWEPYWESKGHK